MAAAADGEGTEGRIFDLERYSTHDGPGIRTTLFLKGCSLRCSWCHNPESIDPRPELMFDGDKCLLDLGCVVACERQALRFLGRDGRPIPATEVAEYRGRRDRISARAHDLEACARCGRCAEVCFARALELVGRILSAAEAVTELARDRPFYERSGGGVTISGGEPLCQPVFVAEVLAGCRALGLHTALDTTAHVRWPILEATLAHTDLVLLDLKLMDGPRHFEHTGVDNGLILDNAARLGEAMAARRLPDDLGRGQAGRYGVWVRVPVIPGANDDEANARAGARFVRQHLARALSRVELLGYHPLGRAKLTRLNRADPGPRWSAPPPELLARLRQIWEEELTGIGVPVAAR
jgi:pyruvate formate lyase activating enzyme